MRHLTANISLTEKVRLRSLSSFFLLFPLIFSSFLLSQDMRPTTAVINFEGRGISWLEAHVLTDLFRGSISKTGAIHLIERRVMEEELKKHGFQQIDCTTDECAVELGQILGVQNMIGGVIGKVGSTYTIDVRTISVETGTVLRTQKVYYVGDVDGLIIEFGILAYELMQMNPPLSMLDNRRVRPTTDVVQRNPKTKTRMGSMMRSLAFPGFGQFYSERRFWGYGWILSELAVVSVIYTNYTSYQSACDDYKEYVDLYRKETDASRIVEYKTQAKETLDNINTTSEQIRMLTRMAGGLWMANVLHALIVGPKWQSSNVDKMPSLELTYDPSTHQTQLRLKIVLD